MRWIVVLALPLILSGCLTGESNLGDGSTSDEIEEVATKKVQFVSESYSAAPSQPATFNVDVPDDAMRVTFRLMTSPVPGQAAGTVTLEGCGEATVAWGGNGNVVISNSAVEEDVLCDDARAGAASLVIEAQSVPLSGTIELTATVPA